MTSERLWVDSLRDIHDAASKALAFVHGMDFEPFRADDKTVFAVIRALEIVGEAARGIPGEVRARYPLLPWRSMTGMRDKLIHAYFGVSVEVVWETLEQDLPALKTAIEAILAEIDGNDE